MKDFDYGWIPVDDKRTKSIINSNRIVLIAIREYGDNYQFALAKAWQSSLVNQPVQWYLDEKFYGLEHPFMIADKVWFWLDIPPVPYIIIMESYDE